MELAELNQNLSRGRGGEVRQKLEEAQRIHDRVRIEDLKTRSELHEVEKIEDAEDLRVFESLMGNKKAAEFAVQGRPESRF
jgi:hypothetical protein